MSRIPTVDDMSGEYCSGVAVIVRPPWNGVVSDDTEAVDEGVTGVSRGGPVTGCDVCAGVETTVCGWDATGVEAGSGPPG